MKEIKEEREILPDIGFQSSVDFEEMMGRVSTKHQQAENDPDEQPEKKRAVSEEATPFSKMLNKLRSKLRWRIYLVNGNRFIYRKTDEGYFETLTGPQNPKDTLLCQMEVRSHFRNQPPGVIDSLFKAILQDEDRLIDGTQFVHSKTKGIPFLNGVFDLEKGALRAYRDDDYYFDPIPHEFQSTINRADIKAFRRALRDWVGKPTVQWMVDMTAYMMFVFPNVESIWSNPFGSGRNGKSVYISLLEAIMGKSKSIGVSLTNLNKHSSASFIGRSLIIGRDSKEFVSPAGVELIKNYTGDEYVVVEPKGGFQYDALVEGKMIVSTNDLVRSKDRTFGWYRRLMPIPFPNIFPQDDKFKKELFGHIPGIISYLVARAYKYRCREIECVNSRGHTFTKCVKRLTERIPGDVQTLRFETQFTNDRVAAFFHLTFFDDNDKEVIDEFIKLHEQRISVVWESFRLWHMENFGEESKIEPGRNSFCGASGGFMGKANEYFWSERGRKGRILYLHEHIYAEFMKPKPGGQTTIPKAEPFNSLPPVVCDDSPF